MKADLNRIKAALQQLEQNPNCGDRALVTPQDSPAENLASEATNKAANPTFSTPIPPLQPNRKAPTLPAFDSLDANNPTTRKENVPDPNLLPTTPSLAALMEEVQQVIQQIEILYTEGPIVDGWLESYPCESTPSNNERSMDEFAISVEYIKAASSLEQNKVVWEAPRSCYRLNGVNETGQPWSYFCPLDQLPSVSVAIARYEKLLQLLDRKRDLENRIK